MSLNKVMLIGNVGKKPEVRYLENQQGVKVATFSLATTERFRTQGGDTREHTEWHNVVAWRGLADVCERMIDKGTQLYIEGKIRTRDWTDQTGAKRYTTEVIADTIQLLSRKPDGMAPAAPSYGQPVASVQPEAVPDMPQAENIEDDDLPF